MEAEGGPFNLQIRKSTSSTSRSEPKLDRQKDVLSVCVLVSTMCVSLFSKNASCMCHQHLYYYD